jgi:hypothetical protein
MAACRHAPEAKSGDEAKADTKANAERDALLAQAGVSLADLPLAEPMPGEPMDGGMLPPDDGLLPASLPEFIPGVDDLMPDWDAEPAGADALATPGGWMRSGTDAIRLARQKQLPLVVWLANTKAGPLDDLIGAQVLFTPEVTAALKRSAVPLRIDYGNDSTRKNAYYNAFRTRYKVKGYPCLLILLPDGTEVFRRMGYTRGTAEARVQTLQSDLAKAAEAWKKRKIDLEKSGFRNWSDRTGGVFFAKALRRDDQQAVLIDPFRRVFRVPLARFSHESLVDLLDGLKALPAEE